MGALFASGGIVDLILALVAAEALLMVVLRRWLGPGLGALIVNLGSGAALLLALRAALTGADWPVVAAWLLAGLGAHCADLILRFRAGGRLAAAAGTRDMELRRGRDVPARQ